MVPFGQKWDTFCNIGNGRYGMISNVPFSLRLAPLQLLHFPVLSMENKKKWVVAQRIEDKKGKTFGGLPGRV